MYTLLAASTFTGGIATYIYRILISRRILWVETLRRQGVYNKIRYMDCTMRKSQGTNFLVVNAPPKQTNPFLTLKAEPGFLQFKDTGPFKMT